MSAEIRNMRRLFRAVLSNAMLDYRKEWIKHPDRRERTVGDARRYLNSADGREIIDLCGWEFGPRQIEQALAEMEARENRRDDLTFSMMRSVTIFCVSLALIGWAL